MMVLVDEEVLVKGVERAVEEAVMVLVREGEEAEVVVGDDTVEARLNVNEVESSEEEMVDAELGLLERLIDVMVARVVKTSAIVLLVFNTLEEVADDLKDEVEDVVADIKLLEGVPLELVDDCEVATEDILVELKVIASGELLAEDEVKLVWVPDVIEESEVILLVTSEAENW